MEELVKPVPYPLLKDQIDSYNIPTWIKYDLGDDDFYYIDTQNQPFTVKIYDMNQQEIHNQTYVTENDRREDDTATGFGWKYINELGVT